MKYRQKPHQITPAREHRFRTAGRATADRIQSTATAQGHCQCGHSAYAHRDGTRLDLCLKIRCLCPGFLLDPARDGYGVSYRLLRPARVRTVEHLHALVRVLRGRWMLATSLYQALGVNPLTGRRRLRQLQRRGRLRMVSTPLGNACHLVGWDGARNPPNNSGPRPHAVDAAPHSFQRFRGRRR